MARSGQVLLGVAIVAALLCIWQWTARFVTPWGSGDWPPVESRPLIALNASHLSYANGSALRASDDHQAAAHPTRGAVWERQCGNMSIPQIRNTAAFFSTDLVPIALHFRDGLLFDGSSIHQTGQDFCTVFIIPQVPRLATNVTYSELPIEGWGPDALHAEVASTDVRLVLEHPIYWGSLESHRGYNETTYAVYMAAYTLNHPGNYSLEAEVEWRNYDWVMEIPGNIGQPFETHDELQIPMFQEAVKAFPTIQVEGLPVDRPDKICYDLDSAPDLRGRWYRAEAFKQGGSQTLMNALAHIDFADHNATVDEWGWTFAPDLCNLVYFSPADHAMCLQNRSIHAFADSNTRRLIKSLIGGGENWCLDPDNICQCVDQFEGTIYDMYNTSINATHIREPFDREPTVFGNNSKVFFDFVGGAVTHQYMNGWPLFFEDRDVGSTIIENRTAHHGTADVVHVSLIGWDVAAVRTVDEFVDNLPAFRDTILNAYSPGTRFILRQAGTNCCGNWNRRARFSGPRFAIFNAAWSSFWSNDVQANTVKIHDPAVLQGRKDAEQRNMCPTTHLRTSHVRIEQMMWMTAVCEKSRTDVRMKDSPT